MARTMQVWPEEDGAVKKTPAKKAAVKKAATKKAKKATPAKRSSGK